jgi:hypothetical protein
MFDPWGVDSEVDTAIVRQGKPTTLLVPGARYDIPADALPAGVTVRLSSTPLERSDFPAARFQGETPVSPVVTVGAPGQKLGAASVLQIDVPEGARMLMTRDKTVGASFAASHGEVNWLVSPVMLNDAGNAARIELFGTLPRYSFVVVTYQTDE